MATAAPVRAYHHMKLDHHQTNLLRIDYEVVNAALGIELNVALPSESIRLILKKRLTEMTRDERSEIPEKVLEIVVSITREEPKVVRKTKKAVFSSSAPDAILLAANGTTPDEQLRRIVGSNEWAAWSRDCAAKIFQTEQGIVIQSDVLRNANAEAVTTLLKGFGV